MSPSRRFASRVLSWVNLRLHSRIVSVLFNSYYVQLPATQSEQLRTIVDNIFSIVPNYVIHGKVSLDVIITVSITSYCYRDSHPRTTKFTSGEGVF